MRRRVAAAVALAVLAFAGPAGAAAATSTPYNWSGQPPHTSGDWTTGPGFTFHLSVTPCGGTDELSVYSVYPLHRTWWDVTSSGYGTRTKYSAAVQTWHYTVTGPCSAHVWVTE